MRTITLTSGDVALVDDDDFERLNMYRWNPGNRACGLMYAQSNIGGQCVLMHRMIINAPSGSWTDHKNGNGLDNQKVNLRPCSRAENMRNRKRNDNNTSGFKGVYLDPKRLKNPWRAHIRVNGVRTHLGVHPTKERAYQAYCEAAKRLHGEFARLV